MRPTRLRLSKELLNQARERLLLLAVREEDLEVSEEDDIKPIIIAENVSLEAYVKYCNTERKLPVKIRLANGKIIAYEVSHTDHSVVTIKIVCLMKA